MTKEEMLAQSGEDILDLPLVAMLAKIETDHRSDLKDEFYILQDRHSSYQKYRNEGTLSEEGLQLEIAQIWRLSSDLIEKLYQPRPPESIPPKNKKKNKRWLQIILVGIICLVLITLGSQRTRSVTFELNVTSQFVAFRLAELWDLETYLFISKFEAFPVVQAQVDTSSWLESDHGAFGVKLTEGRTQLVSMPLPSNSALGITIDNDEIIFRPYDLDIELTFNLQRSRLELPEIGYDEVLGDTSEVAILNLKTAEVPEFSFVPHSDDGFEIRNKAISSLNFQLINRRGETPFLSAITEGTVSISGTDYDLSDQPFIDLGNLQSARLTLTKSGQSLQVGVSGKAKDLRVGPSLQELQTINPTYIEYFAENKYANLFWNAIVLIIGTLWGVMNVLRKDREKQK